MASSKSKARVQAHARARAQAKKAAARTGPGISSYEAVGHYTGNHLAGWAKGSTVNCTAVITSPQSMVFGVIPVAILGLAFYLFAGPVMSPWGWRVRRREVGLLRLGS